MAFANGSRIIAGHFQVENDTDAYLGLERDVIGIEEAVGALRHLVTTKAPTVVQRKLRGL